MEHNGAQIIDVIIPAFNEENAVSRVIRDIPKEIVRNIIVCNNNSSDATGEQALNAGAIVVDEPRQGYGAACLKAIQYVKSDTVRPDILVFIDADYSDYPEELDKLVQPLLDKNYDLVIGSRALGTVERNAMTFPQRFGNRLATALIYLLYNVRFTDLGPFRAISFDALEQLNMEDRTYGWTVEMQVKAAKQGLKCLEVPVNYRKRIGHSKISGTVKGTVLAGYKILWTIFKLL